MNQSDHSVKSIVPHLMSQVLDSCINGITLSDPSKDDCPIIYANAAFELMTGYGQSEIIGRNCRFLQGLDRNQKGIAAIKQSMQELQPITTIVRNYCKNGRLFYNELTIKPLFDGDGELVYYAGIQNDITDEVEAELENRALAKRIAG